MKVKRKQSLGTVVLKSPLTAFALTILCITAVLARQVKLSAPKTTPADGMSSYVDASGATVTIKPFPTTSSAEAKAWDTQSQNLYREKLPAKFDAFPLLVISSRETTESDPLAGKFTLQTFVLDFANAETAAKKYRELKSSYDQAYAIYQRNQKRRVYWSSMCRRAKVMITALFNPH